MGTTVPCTSASCHHVYADRSTDTYRWCDGALATDDSHSMLLHPKVEMFAIILPWYWQMRANELVLPLLLGLSLWFLFLSFSFFGGRGLELCHHSTLMTDWLTTLQTDISRFRQNGSWALLGGSVCKILWQIVIIFMCSLFFLLFFFVFFHYVQNWEGSYFDIFHPYCESGNFWILFAGREGNGRGGTSSTSDNMLSPDTLPSSLTVIVVVVIISGVSGWAVFCLFDNSIKIIYKLH